MCVWLNPWGTVVFIFRFVKVSSSLFRIEVKMLKYSHIILGNIEKINCAVSMSLIELLSTSSCWDALLTRQHCCGIHQIHHESPFLYCLWEYSCTALSRINVAASYFFCVLLWFGCVKYSAIARTLITFSCDSTGHTLAQLVLRDPIGCCLKWPIATLLPSVKLYVPNPFSIVTTINNCN